MAKRFYLLSLIGALLACHATAQSTSFMLIGQPGEYITQGRAILSTNTAEIWMFGTASEITLTALGYTTRFAGPSGLPLTVGIYTNALRVGLNGDSPGFDVEGPGRGCNRSLGTFEILEIHQTGNGTVDRLWATFSYYCESVLNPLIRGEVRFNSAIAPQPTQRILRVPSDFATIQAALDDANYLGSDTVLVSPGVYQESLDFRGKWCTVIAEEGPDRTFITPPGKGFAARFVSGESRRARLSGFTFSDTRGIYLSSSSPTIDSNVITNCWDDAIICEFSSPMIKGNHIVGSLGTGFSVIGPSTAVIENNLIEENNVGIGMSRAGSPRVLGNTIRRNHNDGIALYNQCDTYIVQNVIEENGGKGLTLDVPSGTPGPVILNNTILGGLGGRGVGINVAGFEDASFYIGNNIVAGSPALLVSGSNNGSSEKFQHNDFFSPFVNEAISAATNLIGIKGNISADPYWACLPQHDFRLLPGSPCIDSGAGIPTNLVTDFNSSPRILAGDPSSAAVIDMGAFEFDPANIAIPCPYVVCSSNIVIHTLLGSNSVAVQYAAPWATPGAIVTTFPESGSSFPKGTNIVTCTASNAAGIAVASFTVTVLVSPVNDELENALVIRSLPYTNILDTTGAIREDEDPDSGSPTPTVWYRIESKRNQQIFIETTGYSASLNVFSGRNRSNLHRLISDTATLNFIASAGKTYYLMVSPLNQNTGGTLHLSVWSLPVLSVRTGIPFVANLNRSTGTIEVEGTAASTRPCGLYLYGEVKQQRRLAVATGSFFLFVPVSNRASWNATITPDLSSFNEGPADLSLTVVGLDNWDGQITQHDKRRILIRSDQVIRR